MLSFIANTGACVKNSLGIAEARVFPNSSVNYLEAWERLISLESESIDVRLNHKINRVHFRETLAGKVGIELENGEMYEFDEVVIATHLKGMKDLAGYDGAPKPNSQLFGSVTINWNTELAHRDLDRMEKVFDIENNNCSYIEHYNARLFNNGTSPLYSNLLHHRNPGQCTDTGQLASFGYDPNEHIDSDYFPANFLNNYTSPHASHDPGFMKFIRNLHKIQGARGVWYAGAETILNLHEYVRTSERFSDRPAARC